MLRPVRSLLPLVIAAALGLSVCSAPEPGASGSQNTAAEAVAPAVTRPLKQYAIEDFIDTVSVQGASFSSDDSRVMFSSNRSGIWNAYTMPIGGGEWTAVTQSTTDNVNAVGYFPNDARMLVTRDAGGNELNHLYVIEADGSERDLTPGDKLKAAFAGFNRAGDAFYVSSNERDPKFFDIYRYDAKTYARELAFENKDGYEPGEISDDGRYIALGRTRTTNDNDLHLVELASGKSVHLTPHEGDASFSAEDFSPDGKYLYYTSNQGGEFSRIRLCGCRV